MKINSIFSKKYVILFHISLTTDSIKLRMDSFLNVPINNYPQDFTFIVNGEIYKTNKFHSDYLSPKISKLHQIDLELDQYSINTQYKGNFKTILNLFNFQVIKNIRNRN